MRWSLFLLFNVVIFFGPSCISPVEKVEGDREELVELCARFLDYYCAGRFDEVQCLFAPHAVVAVDRVDKNRQSLLTAEEFLAKSRVNRDKGIRFTERLVGKPIVLRDHNVACLWAPYRIEAEGGNAEGIDVFQWIKLDGEWRLVSLSYTNRSAP